MLPRPRRAVELVGAGVLPGLRRGPEATRALPRYIIHGAKRGSLCVGCLPGLRATAREVLRALLSGRSGCCRAQSDGPRSGREELEVAGVAGTHHSWPEAWLGERGGCQVRAAIGGGRGGTLLPAVAVAVVPRTAVPGRAETLSLHGAGMLSDSGCCCAPGERRCQDAVHGPKRGSLCVGCLPGLRATARDVPRTF